jgi:hypothetical protein
MACTSQSGVVLSESCDDACDSLLPNDMDMMLMSSDDIDEQRPRFDGIRN